MESTSSYIRFISKYATKRDVIELYLKAIIYSYFAIRQTPKINTLKENKIRNKLAFHLENENSLLKYWFDQQVIQLTTEGQIIKEEDVYRTDIVFFVSALGTFVVECKKLTSAEQRYISDGIKRFTDLKYAQKDKRAGMIGFVTKGDTIKIHKALAKKVAKFSFDNNFIHLLNYKCIDWNTSFQSMHTCKNNKKIQIFHLLFCFVQKYYPQFQLKIWESCLKNPYANN